MTPFRGNRPPSPELLAAYFDGECEGRDDLIPLRRSIEAWLAEHPEAQAEQLEYRVLLQAWQETAPAEPEPQAWADMLTRLQSAPRHPAVPKRKPRWWPWVGAVAAAVCLFVVWPREVAPVHVAVSHEVEVFPVAEASEVTILRVEGADMQTLVVGELPVQGSLELVSANEVTFTSIQPDAEDNMLPEMRLGAGTTPLIWARAESE